MVDMKKEKEPAGGMERIKFPEDLTTVEAPKREQGNLEVTTWIEKIEKKFARVPNDTSDVTDDQVVVQHPQAQQPPVTLPVNQQTMQKGKKGKVGEGVTWLVAWVVRQIKMLSRLGRKVRLEEMPEVKS